MRVKSRKPEAAKLQHLLAAFVRQVVGGAADGEGDQMRQMRHDRQHPVVMRRLHRFDHRAAAAPELGDLLHRRRVGAGRRRQQRPAALEQGGEAGIGAGILGAGHRMRRHEMHARRHQRPDVADHRLLGGADIGQDRPRREMRRDARGQVGEGAHRGAQHDAVGALHRARRDPVPPGRRSRVPPPGPASSGVRALTTISAARSPRSRAMRATELPISPMPSSARRRNRGSGMMRNGGTRREMMGQRRILAPSREGVAGTGPHIRRRWGTTVPPRRSLKGRGCLLFVRPPCMFRLTHGAAAA